MSAPNFLRFMNRHVEIVLFILATLFTHTLAYTELSDAVLGGIPAGGTDFDIHAGSLLAPLLIPRVPGTEGSTKAQAHFVNFFKTNLPDWTIEWHNSTSKTPATGDKEIPFSNLIFRRDPPWARAGDVGRLTLVAHYDSLYQPTGFIGAIDSAAPCAMLLHVARSIETALVKKWDAMKANGDADSGLEEEKGIQIIFLDGEEAWVTWTAEDSLYGSRYVSCELLLS
jgi:glutaminyl-peptide cyclotransferase